MLARQAKAVLDFDWTGEYPMPGPRLYLHQWSWDSAFIAIGYSHYDQERAMSELRHLFEAQWKNGLLPQIVFNWKHMVIRTTPSVCEKPSSSCARTRVSTSTSTPLQAGGSVRSSWSAALLLDVLSEDGE
jgi:hypothetical protein